MQWFYPVIQSESMVFFFDVIRLTATDKGKSLPANVHHCIIPSFSYRSHEPSYKVPREFELATYQCECDAIACSAVL